MNYSKQPRVDGSVLIWTLLILALLALAGAELLRVVSSKYNSTLQAATWQEALLAAESGVDLALLEMRKSLYPGANQAWQPPDWTVNGASNYGRTEILDAGRAGTDMRIKVNVDKPGGGPDNLFETPAGNELPSLIDPNNPLDRSWDSYRIRAIGTMPMTGPARASDNKQDTRLRRLSLLTERFADASLPASTLALAPEPFAGPQVSRRIEAIVRPVSSFDQAIVSDGTLNLNNLDIEIDSYDSRDPNKSTNGLYDASKRQENGNIATNGNLINAGDAHIYGDVATNSGSVSGTANVTGVERTDFYRELIPIDPPSWPSINPSPSSVNHTNTTLTAHAERGHHLSRYILSEITIAGGQRLTFAGNPGGSRTYIEIYVTGDISVHGTADLIVDPGVQATIYFAGNVTVSGNGIINRNNQPGDLLLYGIQPPANTARQVSLGGNANISAAVYAPGHDVTINGSGSNGHVYGSAVGKTVHMTGVTNLHYDEALSSGGKITDYRIVSWFEDTR